MRRLAFGGVVLVLAVAAHGAAFERFLSPQRPEDRAIMNYLELAKSGRASSMDLADLGVLIFDKGFAGDAEDYLKAALKLDKHNYEAAYRLGLVEQRLGNDRKAVHYYTLVLKQRRGYAEARFMLAMAEERCGRREAAIRDYAKAYRYNPSLANPKKNPLVYDSKLQTEAVLLHYRESAATSTLPVTEIDPAQVRRMMEARPQAAGAPAPASAAPAAATPSPAVTAPATAAPGSARPAVVLPGGPAATPPATINLIPNVSGTAVTRVVAPRRPAVVLPGEAGTYPPRFPPAAPTPTPTR